MSSEGFGMRYTIADAMPPLPELPPTPLGLKTTSASSVSVSTPVNHQSTTGQNNSGTNK